MGSVPSRGGPRKRRCPGSPTPRRKRHSAPDGTKPNGPSSPGWCALRLRSPLAKPSSCGSSGTPGWRPGPVTAASAGIAWSATRWPRSLATAGWRSSSVGGSWPGTSRSPYYGSAGATASREQGRKLVKQPRRRGDAPPASGGLGFREPAVPAELSLQPRSAENHATHRRGGEISSPSVDQALYVGPGHRVDTTRRARTPPRPPRQSPGHGRGSSAAWLFDAQSLHVGV